MLTIDLIGWGVEVTWDCLIIGSGNDEAVVKHEKGSLVFEDVH